MITDVGMGKRAWGIAGNTTLNQLVADDRSALWRSAQAARRVSTA